jgi:hypothetical protein
MLAARGGHSEIVEYLADHGADLNLKDKVSCAYCDSVSVLYLCSMADDCISLVVMSFKQPL